MKLFNPFKQLVQQLKYTRYDLQRISRLVNDPKLSRSYFPEATRKSKRAIWRENLRWLVQHKEVNRYYYVYGQDRKNIDAEKEVLPYRAFRIIRNSTNLHPNVQGFNYVCLLRDKFIFAQLLSSLHFPTPKNKALLNKDGVTWLDTMTRMPLASLATDPQLCVDGFCKKLTGIMGEGAFPLTINNGKIESRDKEISPDDLKEKLSGEYLLQERIVQHPTMSSLHLQSVNTIRMITFNNAGAVSVFCATLRIGAGGRSVDNWASGGIVVGIDLETGTLRQEGFFKPGYGGRISKHPDSNILFEGFAIPFFKESIAMACQLHNYLYGIHSVGWDIAITPEGPVFIEGNDDWEGGIPMSLEKDFKSRFLAMFPNRGADVNVRGAKTVRTEDQ